MRQLRLGLILGAILIGLSACASRGPIPLIPATPAVVQTTDVQFRVVVGRTVTVLDAMGDTVADLSRVERKLNEDGVVTAAFHTKFRAVITVAARSGLSALDQIDAGVKSWAELKVLVDPLIAQLNELITLINSTGGTVKDALGDIAKTLAEDVSKALNVGGA